LETKWIYYTILMMLMGYSTNSVASASMGPPQSFAGILRDPRKPLARHYVYPNMEGGAGGVYCTNCFLGTVRNISYNQDRLELVIHQVSRIDNLAVWPKPKVIVQKNFQDSVFTKLEIGKSYIFSGRANNYVSTIYEDGPVNREIYTAHQRFYLGVSKSVGLTFIQSMKASDPVRALFLLETKVRESLSNQRKANQDYYFLKASLISDVGLHTQAAQWIKKFVGGDIGAYHAAVFYSRAKDSEKALDSLRSLTGVSHSNGLKYLGLMTVDPELEFVRNQKQKFLELRDLLFRTKQCPAGLIDPDMAFILDSNHRLVVCSRKEKYRVFVEGIDIKSASLKNPLPRHMMTKLLESQWPLVLKSSQRSAGDSNFTITERKDSRNRGQTLGWQIACQDGKCAVKVKSAN